MHRALVIFCVLCTASLLVTVKAQPGKMRILPGLTFYSSDDSMGGGGGTQSLNDEDRNLLNTVLRIISRPEMQKVLEDLQSTIQNGENGAGAGAGSGSGSGDPYQDPPGSYPKPGGNGNGNGGMPIATINVYPGYPGGSQAMTDASARRMVHFPKDGPQPGDVAADGYDDDNSNNASPADSGFAMRSKYYMPDNMNEIKEAIHQYNGEDVFANQNFPTPNDNYFDSSSSLHQILPALDRRSLSKLDQKEEFTNAQQLAEKLGQRRMMQYEKPSPGNHFSSFLFPKH